MVEPRREPWERMQDPRYPAPGLQFLRGFLEAVALWALVTVVISFVTGRTAIESDELFFGGLIVGVCQIVYLLPIALFVANRGISARAAGLVLPWALGLLLFWSLCGHPLGK